VFRIHTAAPFDVQNMRRAIETGQWNWGGQPIDDGSGWLGTYFLQVY